MTNKKENDALDEIDELLKEMNWANFSKLGRIARQAIFDKLEAQLRLCETEEAGYLILEKSFSNKQQLVEFAKHLDAYSSSDSIKTLKEKTISTTIGFRLRSAAVRGE